jgi:hypothetical protein
VKRRRQKDEGAAIDGKQLLMRGTLFFVAPAFAIVAALASRVSRV